MRETRPDPPTFLKFGKGGTLMSAYKDYIRDYPKRCLALLDTLEVIEKQRVQLPKGLSNIRKHNVTYILSLASTGIVIPWERLQKGHRSGDSIQFGESVRELEKLKVKWSGNCGHLEKGEYTP